MNVTTRRVFSPITPPAIKLSHSHRFTFFFSTNPLPKKLLHFYPNKTMQRNGEHATAENDGPAKRQRRPSVRLNQPYYVNPSQVNLQKKWDAFKKDLEGAKKARNKRNAVEKIDDDDDDLAIGNWKNLKIKGKRKMGEQDQEKEESLNSNGSDSEKQGETGDETEEEENFQIEKSNEFRRSPSCDDSGKQGKKQMALTNGGGIRGSEGARNRPKGVKMWLNELGLAKYESLFGVHEVDEEVLPLLTLEDLKDMGINAVGSRRKMYSSIQKLGNGFA